MDIFKLTSAEKILREIQQKIDRSAQSLNMAAKAINNAHSQLWSLPDEDLLDVLNFLGPVKVQELFNIHETRGNQINEILNDFDFPGKSLVTIGVGKVVSWNGESFEIEEPEIEEVPEEGEPEE